MSEGVKFSQVFGPGPSAASVTSGYPLTADGAFGVFGVTPTTSGVSITPSNSLTLSAVWCAVQVISQTVALLPLQLCRRTKDGGREVANDHYLSKLIRRRPNRQTSWFTFRETKQAHCLTYGNGYSEIERDNAGRVKALWQITPDCMQPELTDSGDVIYQYDGGSKTLQANEVLHIPGLGFDGLVGYSPIRMARESLGLAASAEKYGASFFGNSARPSGLLIVKGLLPKNAKDSMREEWQDIHGEGDPTKKNRVAILQGGADFKPLTFPPEEAQFLETRKFSVTEVARWFNLPPHMLKDLERATYSNIEEQGRDFLTYTLLAWLERWTQELNFKLLSDEEQEEYYFHFVVDGLLRANIEKRYKAYAVGRQWGWFSANDIRRLEDLPPIPDGDVYLSPSNMTPADKANAEDIMADAGLVGPNGEPIRDWIRSIETDKRMAA